MGAIRRVVLLTVGLLVFLGGVPGWATQNATVTGFVRDERTDSAISGATVVLWSASTSFKQEKTSDADGGYTFNEVPPSDDYILQVSKNGYDPFVRDTLIEVKVADYKVLLPDARLKPVPAPAPPPPKREEVQPPQPTPTPPPTPGPTPTPTPTPPPAPGPTPRPPAPVTPQTLKRAESVSVETVNNTLGGVIDSRALRTLPLADRDFLDLALLTPGTYPVEQGSPLEGASLVVNGVRANMNNFLLDGADDNDYTINQSLPFQLVEAMQEFRVQASTSTAGYGRSGGAQINTISRRGTPTVHGTLFEYHRNSALSPDGIFSVYRGSGFDHYVVNRELFVQERGDPLSSSTLNGLYNGRRKPEVIQNQFGGNAGGALIKDKVFGFFNWESFRVSNPRPTFERVPGLALRQPFDTGVFRGTPARPVLENTVTQALYRLYPAPNVSCPSSDAQCIDAFGIPFADPNFFALFVGESANNTASDNLLERIDLQKSDRASLSFKHNIQWISQVQGGTLPRTSTYPGNGTLVHGQNQNFSTNYVQGLKKNVSNELRLAWNRFDLSNLPLDRTVDPTTLGFKNVDFRDRGLPNVYIGGSFTLFGTFAPFATLGSDISAPSARANNVWSAADNVSYIHGAHNLRFGGEFRYVRLDVRNEALGRGVLGFFTGPFPAFSGLPDIGSIARVSPLFGGGANGVGGGFDRSFRTNSLDGFVQDQWRPRANVSLSYGLRYEANQAPVEARDRLVNFYPDLRGGLGGLVRANDRNIFDPFGHPFGTTSSPAPRAGFQTDKNNFAPHFGFAVRRGSGGRATVARGAYDIMFDQEPLESSVNMLLNPPFVWHDFSFFNTSAPFSLSDTFGVAPLGQFAITGKSGWDGLPYAIVARDPGTRTPYVQQFNFGVQQQLGTEGLFEVGYVGSAGRKLPRLRNITACTAKVIESNINTNPLACFFTFPGGFQLGNADLFSHIVNQENSANSSFHSLLLRFESRGFRGIQVNAHYQFAKSIDSASSLLPQEFLLSPPNASLLTSAFGINPDQIAALNNVSPALSLRPVLPFVTTHPRLPQDSNNLRAERARSDFDVHHRLVLNFIYEAPRWDRLRGFGRGWRLAGIATVQSGQPFTIFDDFFGTPLRPNLLHPPKINDSDPNAAIDPSSRPTFSRIPTGGTQQNLKINFDPATGVILPGNLGRNTFTGPRLYNLDFSILKDTFIGQGERKGVQFRAEFFNVTNTTNFRQPYSNGGVVFLDPFHSGGPGNSTEVFDPFFGRILQARPPMAVQFAIKFSF